MRRLAVAALIAAVVAVPASAQEGNGASTRVAFRGTVMGVSQDAGSIAWLQWSPDGCRFRSRAKNSRVIHSVKYAPTCNPLVRELVLAGGKAAWGGNDEVICGKTYAAVYAVAGRHVRRVQRIPGDCLGFGPSLRGLVSDGRSFYYNVLDTVRGAGASQCGDLGGSCRWQLAGGHIVRIDGSRPVALRGLPPTVMLAVAAGRVALVQPLREVASNGNGAAPWPRAARTGKWRSAAWAPVAWRPPSGPRGLSVQSHSRRRGRSRSSSSTERAHSSSTTSGRAGESAASPSRSP